MAVVCTSLPCDGVLTDNNNCDYEHDVNDPNKDLFPLGKEVPIEKARLATLSLGILLFIYGTWLARSLEAEFVFLSMYAFGLLYNRISKESYFAGVWIAMCFGPMALFSYAATKGGVGFEPTILLVTAYLILQVYFQNGISGSMKDLKSDRVNLFKALGVKTGRQIVTEGDHVLITEFGKLRKTDELLLVPKRAFWFAIGVKLLGAVPLAYLATGNWQFVQFVPSLSALPFWYAVFFTWQMMEKQLWDNKKLVMRAAVIEIFTFYALVMALSPAIGYVAAAFVVVFSLAWYVILNRVMWATNITPRV